MIKYTFNSDIDNYCKRIRKCQATIILHKILLTNHFYYRLNLAGLAKNKWTAAELHHVQNDTVLEGNIYNIIVHHTRKNPLKKL